MTEAMTGGATAAQRSMVPSARASSARWKAYPMDRRKIFTVDEANTLIPSLEDVLGGIERRIEEVQSTAERLQVLDVLWGEKVLASGNPDHAEAQSYRLRIATLMGEIEEIVERDIHGRGLRFPQGGLEHGLIDFPTTWEGRWVFLCWRRGEPEIRAWHEIDQGFAGRQELTAEHQSRMGFDDPPDAGWLD